MNFLQLCTRLREEDATSIVDNQSDIESKPSGNESSSSSESDDEEPSSKQGAKEAPEKRRRSSGSWYRGFRMGSQQASHRQNKLPEEDSTQSFLAVAKASFAVAVRNLSNSEQVEVAEMLHEICCPKSDRNGSGRGLRMKAMKRSLRKALGREEIGTRELEVVCGLVDQHPDKVEGFIEVVELPMNYERYSLLFKLSEDKGLRSYFERKKAETWLVSHREAADILNEESSSRWKKSQVEDVLSCFKHSTKRKHGVNLGHLRNCVFSSKERKHGSFKAALQSAAQLVDVHGDATLERMVEEMKWDKNKNKSALRDKELVEALSNLGCFVRFINYRTFIETMLDESDSVKPAQFKDFILRMSEDDESSASESSVDSKSFESRSELSVSRSDSDSMNDRSSGEGSVSSDSHGSSASLASSRRSREEMKTNKSLVKELQKAFKVIDSDGNGYVDERELSQAMAAVGTETALTDIRDVLEEHEIASNGTLSQKEFVHMMQVLIKKRRKETLPDQRHTVLAYISKLRKALGPELSRDELFEALQDPELFGAFASSKAKKEQLEVLAEALQDGQTCSLDRLESLVRGFTLTPQRKARSRIPKDLHAIIEIMLFGEIADPTHYLKLFRGLPDGFRLSWLQPQEGKTGTVLKHMLEQSVVAVHAKSSLKAFNVEISFKLARGIPVVGNSLSALKVVHRQVRMSLYRKRHDGRRSAKLVGNQFLCQAVQDSAQEDIWRLKNAKILIHIDGEDVSSDLALFIELTAVLDLKGTGKTKDQIEFSCGWAAVGISTFKRSNQDMTLALNGGSLICPEELQMDGMQSRRSGWRALVRRSSTAVPMLALRCLAPRTNPDSHRVLSGLNSSAIFSSESIELLSLHRSLFRHEAEMDRRRGGNKECTPCFVPELHILSHILSDGDLTHKLSRMLRQAVGRRKGQHASEKQRRAFREAVLKLWPMNVHIALESVETETQAKHLKEAPDFIHSKPEHVLFEPFGIEQLLV